MMNTHTISQDALEAYRQNLAERERSEATISKYLRDVRRFFAFANGQPIDKLLVLRYKTALAAKYAVSSANSMLAALNSYLRFAGLGNLCVQQLRTQRLAYTPEDKELTRAEYERLVNTPCGKSSRRIQLIIQTICATGIRVSELQHITIDALLQGETTVRCKGKTRTIFLVRALCDKLLKYAAEHGIACGPVFVTRHGKPVSRVSIWRGMKRLCQQAGVAPGKVFPHNLRHLFARTFYSLEKDIAKLADLLGHASINTTRIYIATTGAEHRRKMEQMNLVF